MTARLRPIRVVNSPTVEKPSTISSTLRAIFSRPPLGPASSLSPASVRQNTVNRSTQSSGWQGPRQADFQRVKRTPRRVRGFYCCRSFRQEPGELELQHSVNETIPKNDERL